MNDDEKAKLKAEIKAEIKAEMIVHTQRAVFQLEKLTERMFHDIKSIELSLNSLRKYPNQYLEPRLQKIEYAIKELNLEEYYYPGKMLRLDKEISYLKDRILGLETKRTKYE